MNSECKFYKKLQNKFSRITAGVMVMSALLIMPVSSANALTLTSADLDNIEAGMDAIFSQTIFGLDTIDIRFGSLENIVAPSFLTINELNFGGLLNLVTSVTNTINMFFIDELVYQGRYSVVGLARVGGNLTAVEKRYSIRSDVGPIINAHEVGHNLRLLHEVSAINNIMYPSVWPSNVNFTQNQLDDIFASRYVQQDLLDGGYFININPYQIVATNVSAVPIPAALPLFSSGLAFMGFLGWRRKRASKAAA